MQWIGRQERSFGWHVAEFSMVVIERPRNHFRLYFLVIFRNMSYSFIYLNFNSLYILITSVIFSHLFSLFM